LFDSKHNLVDLAYDQISVSARQEVGDATKRPHDRLYRELVVSQPGYAYIYVSNESPTLVEVYFDDLTLTHRKSPVVRWDDYYPFGMGINSISYQNSTLQKNDFLYNGKERQEELGVGWLDYGARMYMAEIGRWVVVDPMIEKHFYSSPHVYVYNSPIRLADLFGLDSTDRANFIKEELAYVEVNPGGTYGWDEKKQTPTVSEHALGAKMDCAGLVRAGQINMGNPDPTSGKKWRPEDNAVSMVVKDTEERSVDQLEDGNYVTFKTNRQVHRGPDGKFDHIGTAYNVKRENGKVVSFDVIHSFGSGSDSGPKVTTNYIIAEPKSWLTLKGVFKWDKENKDDLQE
jgi:RHS repeat-associated protein